jgi:hypothetical protein
MGYKGRDVEVVSLNEEQYLVAACDSCGAIGMKELDRVKVPWTITGRFTARVALLEVLSIGAVPKMITVAISNEPEPTGEEILKGVREELRAMDLVSLPMAISTEKNMLTQQTGLGITAVGLCEKKELRLGQSKSGDSVFCLGVPKVGAEIVSADDPEIAQGRQIKMLLEYPEILDIIPIGSRGIQGEAESLAMTVNAQFIPETKCPLDLEKSAGPSTCLIFTAPDDIQLPNLSSMPICKVGKLSSIL